MELETPRLRLDCCEDSDASFIVRLLNDASFLRFIGDKGVRTEADAREYLRGPSIARPGSRFGLGRVRRKDSGEAVGLCGLLDREGLDDVDLGFAFVPEARGQGLAREAAEACLRHGFEELGLPRIVAITTFDNQRSARLLEALGMRAEGEIVLPGSTERLCLYTRSAT